METWVVALVVLALVALVMVWFVQRGRHRRRTLLRHNASQRATTPASAPPERRVEEALRQRAEELSQRPRSIEIEAPSPPAVSMAPPNPLSVKLDEPQLEVEAPQESGTSRVQRMAQEQWDQVQVVAPQQRSPPPVSRPREPEFEAPKPKAASPAAELNSDWGNIEVRKDRKNP